MLPSKDFSNECDLYVFKQIIRLVNNIYIEEYS